jgi:nucleotide-binding universal stress UspA family protein
MKRIVVGVDGSVSSHQALREALRLARLEGADLHVVTAWHVPSVSYGGMFTLPLTDLRDEFERDARQLQENALQGAGARENGVAVDRTVREGHAAKVLLDLADEADLLVVGCRGHGGFTGLLLGSVSNECASHARCPVLIVHRHEPNGSRERKE